MDKELLDRDEPGAPPGFLLDRDDKRTHEAVEITVEVDIEATVLAKGGGEEDDDDGS